MGNSNSAQRQLGTSPTAPSAARRSETKRESYASPTTNKQFDFGIPQIAPPRASSPQPPHSQSSHSQSRPRETSHNQNHHPNFDMGNSQSTEQDEHGKGKGEVRRRERDRDQQQPRAHQGGQPVELTPVQAQKSSPVRLPGSTLDKDRRHQAKEPEFAPSSPPRDSNYISRSNFNFPPRLPLPIQEEIYTPGSPIIAAAGALSADLQEDDEDGLPRRTSLLSHTTIDEDDGEYEGYGTEGSKGKTVPTVVTWNQGGDRVYITGTFATWSRKYRMHRDAVTNVLSAILDLPPGTHHVKFIVDGDMQLSKDLPTAVDYTNILVNYIEVSADDIPKDPVVEETAPEGVRPPQVLPPGTATQDHATGVPAKAAGGEVDLDKSRHYGGGMPRYLLDLDKDEKARHFQRAAGQVTSIPAPPTLPLFLTKSILNGTTPMKDDSSVLNMPNHTVLNHLATSSIKSEVLATCLTTRYKRKYVTTITYRPTTLDVD